MGVRLGSPRRRTIAAYGAQSGMDLIAGSIVCRSVSGARMPGMDQGRYPGFAWLDCSAGKMLEQARERTRADKGVLERNLCGEPVAAGATPLHTHTACRVLYGGTCSAGQTASKGLYSSC